MTEAEDGNLFSEMVHRHESSVASHGYARVNKSIIYIATHERRALINKLSRSKAPKTNLVEHCQHP